VACCYSDFWRKPKESAVKITKICVHLNHNIDSDVKNALLAAFQPFGSLTEGIDGNVLAEKMIDFVTTNAEKKSMAIKEIMDIVYGANTDSFASVEIGFLEVALRTPTSGTRIRLRRYAGAYHVDVNFGSKGSMSRATSILANAEKNGVMFDAYNGQERLERSDVLNALLKRAENHLAWLEALKQGYYSEEYMASALVAARAAVAFFETRK